MENIVSKSDETSKVMAAKVKGWKKEVENYRSDFLSKEEHADLVQKVNSLNTNQFIELMGTITFIYEFSGLRGGMKASRDRIERDLKASGEDMNESNSGRPITH